MATKFPRQIDDSTSLTVANNNTGVAPNSVNQLRDAIIAVETALGVNPGSTFGTVSARIQNLENLETSEGGGSGAGTGAKITAPDWYIDPILGNNLNSGITAGSPLQSWAGLLAKWGYAPKLIPSGNILTVHLLGNLDISDGISFREDIVIGSDVQVVILGKTTTVRSGVLTGATAVNRSLGTCAPWKATDTTVVSWTTDVHNRLRVTSGANVGATCWICADVTGNTADVSAPILPTQIVDGNLTLPVISPGDPYVIETLSTAYIQEICPSVESGTSTTTYPILRFKDLQIGSTAIFGTVIRGAADFAFQGCRFSNFETTPTGQNPNLGANFVGCCFDPGGFLFLIGTSALYAGVSFGEVSTGNQICAPHIDCDFIMYGPAAHFGPAGIVVVGTMGAFHVGEDAIRIFNGMYLVNGTQTIHALYGANNVGHGVSIEVANAWLRSKTFVPTITGTLGDIAVHGKTSLPPWNDATHSFLDAIPCSWTNLATSISGGGFGGSMINQQSMASITIEAILDAGITPYIITQPDWYIDPIGGSDTNTGVSLGSPFKTFRKLLAKWGPNPILNPTGGTLTIHYLNSAPITDDVVLHFLDLAADVSLVIQAETSAITTAASGTITSVTALSGNTPWQITDTGLIGGWASLVGKRGRITSGPRIGTVFGILKDLGGGSARITQPVITSIGAAYAGVTDSTIQIGDPYVIEDFPNLFIGELGEIGRHSDASNILQSGIFFKNFYIRTSAIDVVEIRQTVDTYFIECRFEPCVEVVLSNTVFFDSCMLDGGVIVALTPVSFSAGGVFATNALVPNIGLSTEVQGAISIAHATILQGCTFEIGVNGHGQVLDLGLGVYDSPGVAGVSVGAISNGNGVGYLYILGHLFGSGNDGYGVRVDAGCRMIWDGPSSDPASNIVPTITGTHGDAALGTQTVGWVFNPATGKYSSHSIPLTWANISANVFSGGFGGSAHHPQLDAHILRATDTPDPGFVDNNRKRVTPITGAYLVLVGDEFIVVTTNAAPFTITLPLTPTTGDFYIIKDGVGNANVNNITISGNGKTIDGSPTYIINTSYGVVSLVYNGTEWSKI